MFRCRKFSLSFFSIVSNHTELNYSDVQNSKENMGDISTATYFAQLEIPPECFSVKIFSANESKCFIQSKYYLITHLTFSTIAVVSNCI